MFRISFLLWLVVLAALNFWLLSNLQLVFNSNLYDPLLVGTLPLLNAFLIGCYFSGFSRFRFSIKRRDENRDFATAFAFVTGFLFVLTVIMCALIPEPLFSLLDKILTPFRLWFQSLRPEIRRSVLLDVGILGLFVSGPSLLIVFPLASHLSR